jgi:O-antigen/teichoic acid export membrane protein
VVVVAVIVARRGYDIVVMRAVSRFMASGSPARAAQALRFALRGVTFFALLVSVGVGFFVGFNPFDAVSGSTQHLLLIMLFSIAPLALLWQFSGFFKGLHRASLGIIFENGGAALATAMLFYLAVVFGVGASLAVLGVSFILGTVVLLIVAVVIYSVWARSLPPPEEAGETVTLDPAGFGIAGREFLAITMGVYMMQAGSFLFAGLMLPEEKVGLLKAAERLTLAVSFWPSVVNPIVAPRIAALYQTDRYEEIGLAARRAALFCLLASIPFFLALFVAPQFVLGIFGPEFHQAAIFLRIMTAGHLVAVAMDPAAHVLTMSGYEDVVRRITLALLGFSLVAFPAAMLTFGAIGFAITSSVFLVAKNTAIVIVNWRRMRLWTVAGPDLAPWLGGGSCHRDGS